MADPVAAVPTDASVTPFYLDKGLWVAVLAPVLGFLNQKFGLTLDPLVLVGFMLPVVAYILGHKWKSGTIAAAQVVAAQAAAAPQKTLGS
jgi:hypothetical protein